MSGYTPSFARPEVAASLGATVTSMAMNFDSTRVAISAYTFNFFSGIVKVYDYIASTNSWVQVGSDITGDEGSRFGVSLDMDWDGNTLIVGAFAVNKAYIYEYNGTSWVNSDTLSIPGPSGNFGWAVSISKDVPNTIAVSDPVNNDVYVYEKLPGTGWTEVFKNNGNSIQNIVPWDRNGNNYILKSFTNRYGHSLRLSAFGNHLIVGQPGDNTLFSLSTSNTDFVPEGAEFPTVVHPDPGQEYTDLIYESEYTRRFITNLNSQVGSVRVFKTDNSWLTSNTQVGGDLVYDNLDNVQSDPERNIREVGWSYPGFGMSVDISPEGDMIVVGAPLYSVRGGDYTYHDGQVITYKLNDLGVWVKINVIPGLKSLKYGTALKLDYTGKRLVVTGCNKYLSAIDVLDWNGTNWFETQPIYQLATVNAPFALINSCYITNGEVACLSVYDVGQFLKQLLTQAVLGNTLVSGYVAADELFVGANDNVQKSSEKFSKSKRISFGGTYYDNTYEGATIENRVYKEWEIGTGQQGEGRSELFIAKTSEAVFDFPAYNITSGGVDFIRLKACEIHLDSYPLYGGDKYQQSPLLVLNYQKNVSIGLPFLDSASGQGAYFRGSSNTQAKLDVNGSMYVRNRLNINVDGGNDILGNIGEQGDVLWDTRNASTVTGSTISSNTIVNQAEQNVLGTIIGPATYSSIERAFNFTSGGKVTATRVMDVNRAKVSLWFKLTVLPGSDKQMTILGANEITSSVNYIVVYVTTYGFKVIIKNEYVPDGGESAITRTTTFTYNYSLAVGNWFHVVASYDNTNTPTFQLFINGQNALTPASTTGDPIPEKLPNGSLPFVVGGDAGMYIGMVMVWGGYANRSPSHVMLYNNGPPSEMLKVGGDAVVSNKLAIGSTNPTEALEVTGNADISGSVTAASITAAAANFSGTVYTRDHYVVDPAPTGSLNTPYMLHVRNYNDSTAFAHSDFNVFSAWGYGGGYPGTTVGDMLMTFRRRQYRPEGYPDQSQIIAYANMNIIGTLTVQGAAVTSDDRLKIDEKYITNGLETIDKLRPQTYIKLPGLEQSNIQGQTNVTESGFIAQEIYYECPELRHLVTLSSDAEPNESVSISNDPTIDPDYGNWGSSPASLNYVGVIPYSVKAIQELHQALTTEKAKVATLEAQMIEVLARLDALTS